MRHARSEDLDQLETLLQKLREIPNLRERTRGVFYLKCKPFLHFHSDAAGLFADVRVGQEFQRFSLASQVGHKALLECVATQLKASLER